MRKLSALLLVLVILFSVSAACADGWTCPNCGKSNTTEFCTGCGTKREDWICPNCGTENADAFCGHCGTARPAAAPSLVGTWQGSVGGYDTFLVFTDEEQCLFASPAGGCRRFVYTFDSASNQILFTDLNSKTVKGVYTPDDDQLMLEAYGSFSRTDNTAVFTVITNSLSMADTLQENDKLVFEYRPLSQLKRFDIVAVNFPDRGDEIFVKRLVGFPGDTVALSEGYLYINGEKQDEPYVADAYRSGSMNDFEACTIPEGAYFLLGDHRNNSNDSRSAGSIDGSLFLGVLTRLDGVEVQPAWITSLNWIRRISIEEYQVFAESGWELPEDAEMTDVRQEIHHYDQVLDHYEDVEVQRSRQVVDHYETYYTYADNGDGTFAELAHKRPVYETEYYTEIEQKPVYTPVAKYATKYYYNIWRWVPARDVTNAGEDHNAAWPEVTLAENEREGERTAVNRLSLSCGGQQVFCQVEEAFLNSVNPGETIYLAHTTDDPKVFISDQYGFFRAEAVIEQAE